MKNLRRNLVGAFLFLILLGFLMPNYSQAIALSWDEDVVRAHNFAQGQLEAHYAKHGYQFGSISQEEYLHAAQALLDAEPSSDVLEKIRTNGDIEHYRVSTSEFAVMTKRGRIRTYFKTNYRYWLRQE